MINPNTLQKEVDSALENFTSHAEKSVVIATKEHTPNDSDEKEGLRINRSALLGKTV